MGEVTNQDLIVRSGFVTAINLVKAKEFSKVPEQCTAEIERNGKYKLEALNLRGSIYFVTGKHEEAVADFQAIIEDESASNEVRIYHHHFEFSIRLRLIDINLFF